MRKTKIIATVGPSTGDRSALAALMRAGAEIFRINASHTDAAGVGQWIRLIRRASGEARKPAAILIDLQGPRVRTGKLAGGAPLRLEKNETFGIVPSAEAGRKGRITTLCREFPRMVKAGDTVLLDNGRMELKVRAVRPRQVVCRVVRGGMLGENKGINLPHAPVTLPALGRYDLAALREAVRCGADFIALSFVRRAADVLAAKRWLDRRGSRLPVIAKIEKPRAVAEIHQILEVSDGMMVARGDLGIEMGVEKVPVIQKQLIALANARRIPAITATQMLESMIIESRPTRAEASDVANAVFDGTDAVMLSGETAIGKHPLAAVRMMSQIISAAERHLGEIQSGPISYRETSVNDPELHAIVHAARHAAKDLEAKAIVVYGEEISPTILISMYRPVSPIIALVPSEETLRRLLLLRGVLPLISRRETSAEQMIRALDRALLESALFRKGDEVVILTGRRSIPGARLMTKIHRIGDR
ncbi:MAG: pyruvate kinase [Candidatus Omnitrophica bacterium]|nr:pyruvate kinase [Candidatus Omnitrophota bacterium]